MPLKNSIKAFKTYLGDKESVLDTNYRKIADTIESHWGYKEFYLYIDKLLITGKKINHPGFPLEALEEIYALQEIHEKIFPGMKQQLMRDTNMLSIDKNRNSLPL